MRTKRLRAVALALGLAVALSGCPKDPYRAAIQGSDDVAQAVSAAIPFIAQYYSAGKLNDQEKAQAAGYLQSVTQANQTFRHAVVAAHTSGVKGNASYVALAQAFVNSVPTDPRAFNYKSTDAQKQFNTVLGAVKAALDAVVVVIQSGKGA
jgi:hypothetical protein